MRTWQEIQEQIARFGHMREHDDGATGCYCEARHPDSGICFNVIASWGEGWEHVSVTRVGDMQRPPFWTHMAWIKGLFWPPSEVVVQYHPAEKDYINNVEGCLHLWRPIDVPLPTPPVVLVGIPGVKGLA